MDKKYFACKWIIRYIDDFTVLIKLLDEAQRLGCRIVYINKKQDDPDGYVGGILAVEAQHEDAFLKLANITKEILGLEGWYSISKDFYLSGFNIDTREMQGWDAVDFMEALQQEGIYNAGRQEFLENKDKESAYYSCDWIITYPLPSTLKKTVVKAEDLNCSLRLFRFGSINGFTTLRFGVRLAKGISIKRFLKETGTAGLLINLLTITEQAFYQGDKLSIFGERWVDKTIADFVLRNLDQENRQRRITQFPSLVHLIRKLFKSS
jgi:hypothetical protein